MADQLADCVLVLITWPSESEPPTPPEIAQELVSTGVAACVSILGGEVHSVYRWQGEVESTNEVQMIVKTTLARVPSLWQRVRDLHPYDVPEFLVIPIIDGNEAYLKWVRDSVL